jgi:hypothetical protein
MTSSFSKVLDQAKEETELQQLYDELDSVRAQLVCIYTADYYLVQSCISALSREKPFIIGVA